MGLFDKFMNTNATAESVSYKPDSEQEAWVSIIYACMAIDEIVSDSELDKLAVLMTYKTQLRGYPLSEFYKKAMDIHAKIGSKKLIDASVGHIKLENKPVLFVMCIEILLSDSHLSVDEKQIIEYLCKALQIEVSLADKIVEVMLIRNFGNLVITD